MAFVRRLAAVLSLVAVTASAAPADAAGFAVAAITACRGDRLAFCADVAPGGGAVRDCLAAHRDRLSDLCRSVLDRGTFGDRPATSPTATVSAGAPGEVRRLIDVAYGGDRRQRLDVVLPAAPGRPAPVLVMVHGGAWTIGDKTSPGVVDAKVDHWLPRGWAFVSVNYRMMPAADPLVQAGDVAAALAFVQNHALAWGIDPGRIVLMGHSAGAHLVALLAAAPEIAARAGARPWRGTVALDSAAYDVGAIMASPHYRFYDRVFGADPAYWAETSPTRRLAAAPAPMLLVCSTRRVESCPQADGFAARVEAVGGRATVARFDASHADLDRLIGRPSPETDAVDAFVAGLGLP